MSDNTVQITMTKPHYNFLKNLLENYYTVGAEKSDACETKYVKYSKVRGLEQKQDEYAHDIAQEIAVYIPLDCNQ